MANLLVDLLSQVSGHWTLNLESRVPRTELYEKRIASSKPSLGFFVLLISSGVIASLGLISNSTAVVIGAMIVAPLMDPILSLSFGIAVADGRLIRRSAVTVLLGVIGVILTSALISLCLGVSHVQSEITARTSPNLIDLGIAIAAAVAGSFAMTRERLSSSIAGVAIAVALVPPLCVCGIGLTLGSEMVAVFGRGTVAGLTNQIAEGSFLLFLANLIGITVASLLVFLIQQYGSLMRCWKNLLIWFGLLGLLCIPLSSALHDFSVSQYMDSEFRRFKSGNINNFGLTKNNPYVWSRVRIMYSNVIVSGNVATLDLVFNAPEDLLTEPLLEDLFQRFKTGATELGLDDIDVNVSVIPNRVFHYAASDV
ncbi:MAG: TIGR00341 family protein [Synechococcus sp.]